ncbi:MAG: hypothetical protein AAFX94_07580 [Myxococcota bacterium]
MERPLSAATYIGRGKADELATLCMEHDATVVLFDNPLSSAQRERVAEMTGCRVVATPGLGV